MMPSNHLGHKACNVWLGCSFLLKYQVRFQKIKRNSMFLSQLNIENFRQFSDFSIQFNSGLNLLVGENNAGKSSIVDAIRIVLDTTSAEWVSLKESDFHIGCSELKVSLKFSDLSVDEMAIFLEHLTTEQDEDATKQVLYFSLLAKITQHNARGTTFLKTEVKSGLNADGPSVERDVRNYLATTYLKPLRNADLELSAGRSSRLSQILGSNKSIAGDDDVTKRLIDLLVEANRNIQGDASIQEAQEAVKTILDELTFKKDKFDPLLSLLGCKSFEEMSESEKNNAVRGLLEKLSLELGNKGVKQGLGYSSLLFMATELMLLTQGNPSHSPLLLVEEPEAHLHPQLQLKFMKYLSEVESELQCILSTHSPILSSKSPLQKLILVQEGKAFPLAKGYTQLEEEDYIFLEKFLDSTKANMFFARGVIFVEGVAESVLLPKISELLNRSFEDYGVSLVSLNGLSKKRYAKVYRSSDSEVNPPLPIKVACITDLDLWPDEAEENEVNLYGFKVRKTGPKGNQHYWLSHYDQDGIRNKEDQKKEFDGDNVKTFISDDWTFEFCLAKYGLSEEINEVLKENPGGGDDSLEENNHLRAVQLYQKIEKSNLKSELSYLLAQKLDAYNGKPHELRRKLPTYIIEAIEYVTEPLESIEEFE